MPFNIYKLYLEGLSLVNLSLGLKSFTFPGGEVSVKLSVDNLKYKAIKTDHQTIVARLQSPSDLVTLIMVTDALKRFDPTPIRLVLPYMPYGRQDRVCVEGEAFSLKAFANLINGLGFQKVTTYDPHSEVTGAVFDNLEVVTQLQVIGGFHAFTKYILGGSNRRFVSPDAGANKKTSALASYFSHPDFIRADKLRDLANGNIKETIVYADSLVGMEVIIADDLADGGRTFTELAKVLRAKGASRVVLYVTHGIWSKGLDSIFNNGIDDVYCTDSFRTDIDPRVTVLNIV